ncbi:MAG: SLC13 family permease [Aureliella sp.]
MYDVLSFSIPVLLAEHAVPTSVTILFACLLVALIACLALEEKLHAKKSVIAGIFAIICLLAGTVAGILPFEEVVVGSRLLPAAEDLEEEHGSNGSHAEGGEHEEEQGGDDTTAEGDDAEGEDSASAGDADSASSEEDRPNPSLVTSDGGPEELSEDESTKTGAGADATTGVVPSDGTDDRSSEPAGASDDVSNDEDSEDEVESEVASEDEPEIHVGGHEISMPVYIPAIDWGVIAIILGSSLFVDITSKSGLFTWIAIKVTKATRGDPLMLLSAYGLMTVVFSAVLNNVTAMIIVGSLTAVSLEKLRRNELLLGFLLTEGLLTNIGGLLTLISSVPNIIVGTAAKISFVEFFQVAAPYVVVATIVTIWLGAWMYGVKRLKTEEQREEAAKLVSSFDENDGIESRGFFWFGSFMLVAFIVTIATTSYLPYISNLKMGFVALAFAGIMLLRYKSKADQFYRALDWDLLGFFMALFVVINVMEHARVLDSIGIGLEAIIGLGPQLGTGLVLVSAAAFSSVTDNIPLAAMLAKILSSLGTPSDSSLWWSVVFGANLGGNITPIGSASTLVAVTIIHKHKLAMSFADFVKTALPFAIIQIVIACAYVLLFLG